MILTKLSVENFGLFRDRYTFDLATELGMGTKPIILFGGKNGAGKTTLFEAFRLCLYGNTLPEFRIKGFDYHKYVKSKIHRFSGTVLQPASSLILLEFEYSKLGQTDRYTIERRWHISEQGLNEEFDVRVNGNRFEDMENSMWQDFIKELIPVGVSKLFFFDGEQIQALAADETDEVHLKDSFYSLLGLDLVDRLQSDLQIHITRNMKRSDKSFREKLDKFTLEFQELESEIDELKQKRGDLENKKNYRKKKVDELQDKLAGEGGTFAEKQSELNFKKTKLEAEIEQKYTVTRELCAGLLPFAFVPNYCKLLKERLTEENKIQSSNLALEQVRITLDSVKKKAISKISEANGIGMKSRKDLIADIKGIFDNENNNVKKSRSVKLLHHLSSLEQNRILHWIDTVLDELPLKVKELSISFDKLTRELQTTEDSLRKVPSDEVVAPLVSELNKTNQEIGKFDTLLKQIDEKIGQLEYRIKNLNFQISSLQSEKKNFEKLNRGLKFAYKAQEALRDYEIRLKGQKLFQLADSLIECLDVLMHKKIFNRALIEPETFAVTLYDLSDRAVPKEQLSAGEKQIYAIAILWALAKTSGRPLPFIVDTPLGRLDSDHRLNLVQNFFPVASHQVIIFSTDTEIDKGYFEELSGHISRSYRLDYDNNEERTRVETGYFWRTKSDQSQTEGLEQEVS